MAKVKLEYLKDLCEVSQTSFGFNVTNNVNIYKNEYIRNRVIMRFDIVKLLTEFFTVETLENYREAIFKLVSGQIPDQNNISQIMIMLYATDEKFKKFLSKEYHFNEDVYKQSLYVVGMIKIIKRYKELSNELTNICYAQRTKTILDINGYVYVAVPDEERVLVLPKGYKGEVLSIAKVWNGQVTIKQTA